MTKLPNDLIERLKLKYPGIPIGQIASDIFDEIKEETFNLGSCTIGMFGTFYCYKTFSTKRGREAVRFKFLLSKTFNNQIIHDKFLLDKIDKMINHRIDLNRIGDSILRRDENKQIQSLFVNRKRDANKKSKELLTETILNGMITDADSDTDPTNGANK